MEPEEVCEAVMTKCLSPDCQMGGLGCDNMTVSAKLLQIESYCIINRYKQVMFLLQVILVCFLHGKSWEEYCAKIAATLEPNLNSLSSALASNGLEKMLEDEDDAFIVDNAVNSYRDNDLESVSNPKQIPDTSDEEPKPFQSDVDSKSVEDPAILGTPEKSPHQNGDADRATNEG